MRAAFDETDGGDVSGEVAKYCKVVETAKMLDFSRADFTKVIKTSVASDSGKQQVGSGKWESVKLGEVAEISRGASPRPIKDFLTNDENGVNWIKIGDVAQGEKYITRTVQKITQQGAEHSKRVKVGDFIISNSMSVGRPYILKIDGCIHDGWLLMSNISAKLNVDYFYYILCSNVVQKQIIDVATGSVVVNLNTDRISTVKIPLPPLPVQERIVAECEAIDEEAKKARQVVDKGEKEIERMFSNVEGERVKLGEVCEAINPSRADIHNIDDNTLVSFIEMASVSNNGYIEKKIDKPIGELKKAGYTYFKEGDIIIAKITPCMENGKCAVATGLTNGIGMGSTEFHVFRTANATTTRFLFYYLNRKEIREPAAKAMTGMSGHRRVPISFYENLQIPLPPLPIQNSLVQKAQAIEAEIDEARRGIDGASERKRAVLEREV